VKKLASASFVFLAAACSSSTVGPDALSSDQRALQKKAAANASCVIENQARCDHLIENRILFGRFFAPEFVGGMDEDEKARGRRLTTKFVVEAVADIKQCTRASDNTVAIINGMEIDGGKYDVLGTSPLLPQASKCFITRQTEAS